MDNQIYYHNSDKFPAIANDYREAKTRAEKITNQPQTTSQEGVFTYALEAVPTFRRTASLPDKIQNGDYLAMTGALGLTLVNIKEDIRDMKSAGKQIYSKINKNYNYDPLYDRKNYQHSFSATRGLSIKVLLVRSLESGDLSYFCSTLHSYYEHSLSFDRKSLRRRNILNFFFPCNINFHLLQKQFFFFLPKFFFQNFYLFLNL